MTNQNKEEWIEEFRGYFDKHLKPKKPSLKNLDREILVDFIEQTIHQETTKVIDKIREVMNPMFPYRDEYHLLPVNEMNRMTGQGEVMMELNKLLDSLQPTNNTKEER